MQKNETIIMGGRTDLCKKDAYPYKEKRDISALYESHRDHPAIDIPPEAKEIVDFIKSESKSDKEVARKICKWVSTFIKKDDIHAEASRGFREGYNKIYMNAEETFRTRTGICGERSLLVIGMLKHAGIPSTMCRPSHSHIAVMAEIIENKPNKSYFICDSFFDTFKKLEGEPITKKKSEESKYELWVTDIVNNYKYNWNLRRESGKEFGLRNYGRELTVEELLDVERAHISKKFPHLDIKLKYGTTVGLNEEKIMKS